MIRVLGFEVECDNCGDHSESTPQASLTRRSALSLAKDRGWVRFKNEHGKMMDYCENCIEAAEE